MQPARAAPEFSARRRPDPGGDISAEARMILKIKRRMRQYPDWYETDPDRVAALVCTELERIGAVLTRDLPGADKPVEVWQVPLSVFNWLVQGEWGESFVRGALKAWSSAQCFNAANGVSVDPAQSARLRAPFLEIAPPLLKAVLGQLLEEDLRVTFAQKFEDGELTALSLRVELSVQRSSGAEYRNGAR
jgi:hypothetical protein